MVDSRGGAGTMNGLQRFMGGSPGQVLLRLVVVSFIVGIVLSALGLTPWDIVDKVRQLVLRVWNMGFGAIEWIWTYFLLGAVIVIPVWIVLRLLNISRN
ncbi:MAG: integrase [Rhizobiales bacterium]|nr:integrase [Hyphomicrobiales bacterium]